MSKLRIFLVATLILAGAGGAVIVKHHQAVRVGENEIEYDATVPDEDEPVPSGVEANIQETFAQPADASALGGYNVLIADRGNNRLIEVTPDKKIVWEYKFNLPRLGFGADDAFFTDGGKTISVNLEEYQILQQIDYATKKVTWEYGHAGTPGSRAGYLSNPDDAYRLANGDVIVADIKNCRIIEITPAKSISRQYGVTGKCGNTPGLLNKPNGDTPLPNGHILISNIQGHNIIELDQNWQPVFSMSLPLVYPSDPQMTKAGNILVSEYQKPGKIIEISKQGNIVWEFTGDAAARLNKPSLAIELPNGNILSNDDYNHRVIVINKQTKKIIWQYGITGKPGSGVGQLNVPDGVDIIKRDTQTMPIPSTSPAAILNTIGQATRHAQTYIGREIQVRGYLLKKEAGYIIISDENGGVISMYDLPVTGSGIATVQPGKKYIFQGMFLNSGLVASNHSPTHLELTQAPSLTR